LGRAGREGEIEGERRRREGGGRGEWNRGRKTPHKRRERETKEISTLED
jgi:hypothetical protein